MKNDSDAFVLKVFIGSTDHFNQIPLYEYIVIQAKKAGIAGATVTRGIMGFGASSMIHSYKFWEISDKVPLMVELVDEEKKLRDFYETIRITLENMKYGCLVTFSRTEIILYRSGNSRTLEL
jgi:uncharacterized protein